MKKAIGYVRVAGGQNPELALEGQKKRISEYAEKNGYHASGCPRECYIDGIWNKESPSEWLTELQLPIHE